MRLRNQFSLELEPAFFNVKVMFNFIMTAQIHMLSALERLKNDDSTHEFRNRCEQKTASEGISTWIICYLNSEASSKLFHIMGTRGKWRPGRDSDPGLAGDSRLYWTGLYYLGSRFREVNKIAFD
jgi:hypothetical protein